MDSTDTNPTITQSSHEHPKSHTRSPNRRQEKGSCSSRRSNLMHSAWHTWSPLIFDFSCSSTVPWSSMFEFTIICASISHPEFISFPRLVSTYWHFRDHELHQDAHSLLQWMWSRYHYYDKFTYHMKVSAYSTGLSIFHMLNVMKFWQSWRGIKGIGSTLLGNFEETNLWKPTWWVFQRRRD